MPFQEPRGALEGGPRLNRARTALGALDREPGRVQPRSSGPELPGGADSGSSPPSNPCPLIQFVCVESLVTALVDMYPQVFRKKNRREVLILGVSVVSFLVGLVMVTEVRIWEA